MRSRRIRRFWWRGWLRQANERKYMRQFESVRNKKKRIYVRFQLFAFKPNIYRHIALPRPLIFPIRNPSKRVVQVYFLLRDYLFLFFLNRELLFVFRDQKVVRAPRKARIDNRYLWLIFYYLFFLDFQFRDFPKITKDYESIKWEWWILVRCYLQSCFFLSPRSSLFFRHSFATFFFA